MHHEHVLTYKEKLSIKEIDYLAKKANRLGKSGRDILHVYQQEDDEGIHIYYEVTEREKHEM